MDSVMLFVRLWLDLHVQSSC